MQRSRVLVHVLWSVATTTAACGRLGFDEEQRTAGDASAIDGATGAAIAMFDPIATTQSPCGASSSPVDVQITNTGTADLVIASASATGQFGVASTMPITIAAGASAPIRVTPPAAVIGTDLGGDVKSGELTFTTNEPSNPTHVVALSSTVVGANLTLTPAAAVMFSGTSGVCPAEQVIVMTNTGNAPATIAVSAVSGFAYTGFSGGALASGSSSATIVRPFTNSACVASGSAIYTVSGESCSSTTLEVTLSLNITGASSCFCS